MWLLNSSSLVSLLLINIMRFTPELVFSDFTHFDAFHIMYSSVYMGLLWIILSQILIYQYRWNSYDATLVHSNINQELAESEEVETRINRMAELRSELHAILTEEKQEGVGGHFVLFMYEVASLHGWWTADLRSVTCAVTLLCHSHLCASVTKQYTLVLTKGCCCPTAGKVTTGLVESNETPVRLW